MSSNVKLIVLNNGLQLLGEVEKREAEGNLAKIYVANPVNVMLVPAKDRQSTQMMFSPFLAYCEEHKTGIPLHVTDILTVVTPVEDVLREYASMFSGLVLPKGSVL